MTDHKRSIDETETVVEAPSKKVKTTENGHVTENGQASVDSSKIIPEQIQYVTLFTDQLSKTKEFFTSALGFTVKQDEGEWIEMAPNNKSIKSPTILGLHNFDKAKNPEYKSGEFRLTFFVEDLNAFHESLVKRDDVSVISVPTRQHWGASMASYKVFDGSSFSVIGIPADMKQKMESSCVESNKGFGVCHLELPVENMERSSKFYTDTFEWALTPYGAEYSCFKTTSTKYPLAGGFQVTKDPSERITYPAVYITTPSIDDSLKKVVANGGKVVKDKYPLYDFFLATFKDTEGNVMALYQK